MTQHEKINYLEFPSKNIQKTKTFFEQTFGWTFTDYGTEYVAFSSDAGMEGGFYAADLATSTQHGSALIVFYSDTLEATQDKIIKNHGTIVKPTFSFPGGRRFHFADPNGNEYAVWSDK